MPWSLAPSSLPVLALYCILSFHLTTACLFSKRGSCGSGKLSHLPHVIQPGLQPRPLTSPSRSFSQLQGLYPALFPATDPAVQCVHSATPADHLPQVPARLPARQPVPARRHGQVPGHTRAAGTPLRHGACARVPPGAASPGRGEALLYPGQCTGPWRSQVQVCDRTAHS